MPAGWVSILKLQEVLEPRQEESWEVAHLFLFSFLSSFLIFIIICIPCPGTDME